MAERRSFAGSVCTMAFAAAVAQGGTYTWTKTAGGTFNWSDAANWNPSTNYPNAAGDVAVSTNDVGNQTIVLNQTGIAVGEIRIGNAADWERTTITTNASSQVLILDNAGAPARLTQNAVNSGTAFQILAPVQLDGGLVVSNNAATGRRVLIRGPLSGANRDITVAKGVFQWAPTAGTIFTNRISGPGLFSKAGAYDLTLTANMRFALQAENGGNPGDGGITGGGRLIVAGGVVSNTATGLPGYGGALYLFGSANNTLVVTNGGRYVNGGGVPIFAANAGGTNSVVIAGNGSTWDGVSKPGWRMFNYSSLTAADGGVITNLGVLNPFLGYNRFRIAVTNGGRLYCTQAWIGGDRSTVTIGGTNRTTGAPAKLSVAGDLYVGGSTGHDTNSVTVAAGGVLDAVGIRVSRELGTGNRLTITNGGRVTLSGASYMNGTNNTIRVSGTDPATGVASSLDLGGSSLIMPDYWASESNTLLVEAGGVVTNGTIFTGGQYNGAKHQYVTVRNGGRVYATGGVSVSASSDKHSAGNRVTVTGSGSVWNNRGAIFNIARMNAGGGYTSQYNVAVVEAGGVLTNCSFAIGTSPGFQSTALARYNALVVTNGGRVYCMGNSTIGNGDTWAPSAASTASNCAVIAGGPLGDSLLCMGGMNLAVGYARHAGDSVFGNGLRVQAGGSVSHVATLTVGLGTGGSNNFVAVDGGQLAAAALAMNLGVGNRFVFNSGKVALGSASVDNGLPFLVGDGTGSAELDLTGGLGKRYAFGGGLVVTNHAVLTGSGTLAGETTLHGTLRVRIGGTVPGTQHDALAAPGQTFTLAGALLDVRLAGGFVPASTDTFTVLTAGALAGTFGNLTPGGRIGMGEDGSFLVDVTGNEIVLSLYRPFDNGIVIEVR